MQLIRKRLKVEFWVDDQLRTLYDIKVNMTFPSRYEHKVKFLLLFRMIVLKKIMIIVQAI